MTYPGPDGPATPGEHSSGATAAAQPSAAAPAEKSGAKKWIAIAGPVLVAGVLGAGALTGWFGIGDPKVGDCVQFSGETDWDVIDCGADEAEAKIVGVQGEKQTEEEFMADETSCAEFETAEGALWMSGSMITEKGSVYCVASI
jgi:hypothetical protein